MKNCLLFILVALVFCFATHAADKAQVLSPDKNIKWI
jgi:hypothetical protein